MQNIINNKRERDSNSVSIILKRTQGSFKYISDSLHDSSKIKIPLDELLPKEKIKESPERANSFKKEPIKDMNGVSQKAIITQDKQDITKEQSLAENEIILKNQADVPMIAKTLEESLNKDIYLPSSAQWFDLNEIHEIEMKALPEYFCGKYPSKNPNVYKEYRNYIISLYRENPGTYLTATSI